jgi:hypothetical protein
VNTFFKVARITGLLAYRASVVGLLLLITSELATGNKYIYAIGSMLFKVLGAPVT